jgi:hypothetical protein
MQSIPIFALRCLRAIFALMMSVLNIPLAQVLFSGMYCVNHVNLRTHLNCSTSPQLLFMLFNVIGLLVFIPLMLVASLVVRAFISLNLRHFHRIYSFSFVIKFVDPSPLSKSPIASINPRADCINLCIRLYLVAVETFTEKQNNSFAWYIILQLLGLGYNAWHALFHQSGFNPNVNKLRAGFALSAVTGVFVTAIITPMKLQNAWCMYLLPSVAVAFGIGWTGSAYLLQLRMQRMILTWHAHIVKANDNGSILSRRASLARDTKPGSGTSSILASEANHLPRNEQHIKNREFSNSVISPLPHILNSSTINFKRSSSPIPTPRESQNIDKKLAHESKREGPLTVSFKGTLGKIFYPEKGDENKALSPIKPV